MTDILRTVIVDDSKACRMVMRRALEDLPKIEIVAEFASGLALLAALEDLKADLVLLDVVMPDMDGLKVLEAINQRALDSPPAVLIVSGESDSRKTLQALSLGALDLISKGSNSDNPARAFIPSLERGVKIVRARAQSRTRKHDREDALQGRVEAAECEVPSIVVLGASTGGPQALEEVVTSIGSDFSASMLIVQHMPVGFIESLAESLASRARVELRLAKAGDELIPGRILLAPGDFHLEIGKGFGGLVTRLTKGPVVHGCRPSVDRLFNSVAHHFEGHMLAVIMTGMGRDGCEGMRALRDRGAYCIAQNEATSVVYGMPRAVVEAGLTDEVLPLERIGPRIQAFGSVVPEKLA